MKRAFSILMLFAVLSSTLSKVWVVLDFKINQNFIAEFLCINKEKPMVMCNGKCYLSSQFKKAEQEEKKQALPNPKEKLESLYIPFNSGFQDKLAVVLIDNGQCPVFYHTFFGTFLTDDIFHPPQGSNVLS
ncbi:MAG TPA: hypothetical protein PKA70_01200 [Saprospiraceae bacterium]|nr:hypothetical protein [Saprospiraceae bacterium]